MKIRTVQLVAELLIRSPDPLSARRIAVEIGRPVRSVHNVVLRLRRAGMVEIAEIVKPIGSRRVTLYNWSK